MNQKKRKGSFGCFKEVNSNISKNFLPNFINKNINNTIKLNNESGIFKSIDYDNLNDEKVFNLRKFELKNFTSFFNLFSLMNSGLICHDNFSKIENFESIINCKYFINFFKRNFGMVLLMYLILGNFILTIKT